MGLLDLQEDVVENFGAFVTSMRDESAEVDFTRYQANLFVNNAPKKGAPVRMSTSLPEDVQHVFYKIIPGLENLEITRPVVAILNL